MRTGRRCCAIPRVLERGYPQISRSGERLYRKPARPHRCLAEDAGQRKCAGASRKTIPACPRRTVLTPICENSARAASTKCSAACPRDGGETEIMLDGDELAAKHDYFRFGGARHSPDHRLEAWSADIKGSEYFTIRVRDWATGKDLDDLVEETDGAVVWSTDCKSLLLRQARRQPPPDAGLASSPRDTAGRRRAGLRGTGFRLVHPYP